MKIVNLNIAVLFGGTSMERDVSVASAAQVVTALRSRGHAVTAIDTARGVLSESDETAVLRDGVDSRPPQLLDSAGERLFARLVSDGALDGFDVVFLALHGGSGEDGTMQALLSAAGICFTGTGMLSSAIAMDKDMSKRLFCDAAVPTAPWIMTNAALVRSDGLQSVEPPSIPVIVKPNAQGSTVGLTLVKEAAALQAAIEEALRFDNEVMLERYVPGRELTVGILDGAPLSVGEIIPASGDLFDYAAKYQVGGAQEIFPADIDDDTRERACEFALRAAAALKITQYCRVDFRLDPDGQLWCLEVNTLPGMTSGSLLPRSAAAVGIDFAQLCERICALALQRREGASA